MRKVEPKSPGMSGTLVSCSSQVFSWTLGKDTGLAVLGSVLFGVYCMYSGRVSRSFSLGPM